jgi:riboflavin synthase
MFTGLIEHVGVVIETAPRLRVSHAFDDIREGDSIAVSGCCLTAVRLAAGSFSADLAPETMKRTTLGAKHVGDPVNLERCLRASDRLGGHIVQGHVDGTGEASIRALGDGNWWLTVMLPDGLDRYCVHKGSIAIDGISLTIAEIEGPRLGFAIIPHTYSHTSLADLKEGGGVNIEVDVLAKYLEKLTHGYTR